MCEYPYSYDCLEPSVQMVTPNVVISGRSQYLKLQDKQ